MDQNMRQQHMFRREYFGKSLAVLCGMFLIVLTIAIGAFLLAKGMLTFTQFHHSIGEFLFSSAWKPSDTEMGGGQVGAAIYIHPDLYTGTCHFRTIQSGNCRIHDTDRTEARRKNHPSGC